jgi:hypothetical protein
MSQIYHQNRWWTPLAPWSRRPPVIRGGNQRPAHAPRIADRHDERDPDPAAMGHHHHLAPSARWLPIPARICAMRGMGEPRCHLPWALAQVAPAAGSSGCEARGRGWGRQWQQLGFDHRPSCPGASDVGAYLPWPNLSESTEITSDKKIRLHLWITSFS